MKKTFTWLLDKWLAGFITASIDFIGTIYRRLPEDEKKDFLSFGWFKPLVTYDIPLYLAIILVIIPVALNQTRRYFSNNRTVATQPRSTENSVPVNPVKHYNYDTFGIINSKWTWEYG